MRYRCDNPDLDENYWALGITYDDSWVDFEMFAKWALENGYSDDLSIDRINPFLGYMPINCRWVGPLVQNKNKRQMYFDIVHGVLKKNLADLHSDMPSLKEFILSKYDDSFWAAFFKVKCWDIVDDTERLLMEEYLDIYIEASIVLYEVAYCEYYIQRMIDVDKFSKILEDSFRTLDRLQTRYDEIGCNISVYAPESLWEFLKTNL